MSSYIVWKFLWACSTKVAPLTGKIFAVHFCIGVFLYSCWNSSPDTKVRWCPIKPRLFAVVRKVAYEIRTNSFAQRCRKKVRNRMKCYKCIKLQSSQPEDAIRNAVVLWNLIWPELRTHNNFVLPCLLKI